MNAAEMEQKFQEAQKKRGEEERARKQRFEEGKNAYVVCLTEKLITSMQETLKFPYRRSVQTIYNAHGEEEDVAEQVATLLRRRGFVVWIHSYFTIDLPEQPALAQTIPIYQDTTPDLLELIPATKENIQEDVAPKATKPLEIDCLVEEKPPSYVSAVGHTGHTQRWWNKMCCCCYSL